MWRITRGIRKKIFLEGEAFELGLRRWGSLPQEVGFSKGEFGEVISVGREIEGGEIG